MFRLILLCDLLAGISCHRNLNCKWLDDNEGLSKIFFQRVFISSNVF